MNLLHLYRFILQSLQHNIGQYGPRARASLHFEQPINCCVLGQQKQSQRPLHLAENLPEQCFYAALGCWWFRSQSLLPINWTYNSSSLQETFIRQAVNCFKLIVSSGGRWYPKSAIPYLWDYMSSVCIPKLKFLRGASNLDIYTIRTNKNTKLAACASKVHWASCLCSAQTVLPSEANPRFNSNRHADYTLFMNLHWGYITYARSTL